MPQSQHDVARQLTDGAVREPEWTELTMQPRKHELYRVEAQFWEAWEDALRCWGPQPEVVAQRLAVVSLKPEAIVRGSANVVVDYVRRHGFTPIAVRTFSLGRLSAHSVWRYQWNKATVDRTVLTTVMGEQTLSLMMVLRDDEPVVGLPGSVRLWGLKGPAKVEDREPHQLRSAVGMTNRMISFVHTPDEPADILRELGILFESEARGTLLLDIAENAANDCTEAALAIARSLEQANPRHSVDFDEVADRLRQSGSRQQVIDLLDRVRPGSVRLDDVTRSFGDRRGSTDTWDWITVAAQLISHDRPGVMGTLDSAERDEVTARWLTR